MKTIKNLFVLSLLCCALFACKEKNAPDDSVKEMKEKTEELATYLTDNYAAGYRISFLTETGETDVFVVERVFFHELLINGQLGGGGDHGVGDDDEDEDDDEVDDPYIAGYMLEFSMRNKAYQEFCIMIRCSNSQGPIEVHPEFFMTDHHDEWSRFEWSIEGDMLTIKRGNSLCRMQKNVGLTYFQFADNTWTLMKEPIFCHNK